MAGKVVVGDVVTGEVGAGEVVAVNVRAEAGHMEQGRINRAICGMPSLPLRTCHASMPQPCPCAPVVLLR